MVRFLIHHTANGKTVFFSQFFATNISTSRLEAVVEVLVPSIKLEIDREGPQQGDALRFATFVISTQDFSSATNKALHEEFDGVQVVWCEVSGVVVSLGLDPTESVYLAQQFLMSWISNLKRHFKTNTITNIYERLDEVCAILAKILPLGQLLLVNPTYQEFLKNEVTALTRAM